MRKGIIKNKIINLIIIKLHLGFVGNSKVGVLKSTQGFLLLRIFFFF